MSEDKRSLSDLVAQGWEVQGFSSAHTGAAFAYHVLLRRQRQHKVLVMSKKPFTGGMTFNELDV